jgi:hypothetical protein
MNLRVDLILETEQRSASFLSPRQMLRLSGIVVPAIGAFLLFVAALDTMRQNMHTEQKASEWKLLEPQKAAALKLAEEMRRHDAIVKSLESWPATKRSLYDQLATLMKVVPPDIQLARLSYDQTLGVVDKQAQRVPTMRLEGRALGADSEEHLLVLTRRMREEAPFDVLLANVEMRGDRDTAAGARPEDRVFRLSCEYHPLKFLP